MILISFIITRYTTETDTTSTERHFDVISFMRTTIPPRTPPLPAHLTRMDMTAKAQKKQCSQRNLQNIRCKIIILTNVDTENADADDHFGPSSRNFTQHITSGYQLNLLIDCSSWQPYITIDVPHVKTDAININHWFIIPPKSVQ